MLCFYFHFSLNSKVFQSAKLAGKLYGDTIPHLLNRHHSDTTLTQCKTLWGNRYSLIHYCQEYRNLTIPMKVIWQNLTKWHMHLLFHLAILLLGVYHEDMPPTIDEYRCARLFIMALFAKYWKLPKCSSIGE